MTIVGGFGEERAADAELAEVLSLVRGKVVEEAAVVLGRAVAESELEALSYRTQVVAGTNYLVRMKAGEQILSVKVWRKLGKNRECEVIQVVKEQL